jgi:hypothetical protein
MSINTNTKEFTREEFMAGLEEIEVHPGSVQKACPLLFKVKLDYLNIIS